MKSNIMSLILIGSFAAGFGFGFGLVATGKPFILEAKDTPIGTVVLRGNLVYVEPMPLPDSNKEPGWFDYLA